jgi:hypothetical protein
MRKLANGLMAIVLFGLMFDGTPAAAQAPSEGATVDQPLLKAEELDQLVAPIALYPDALLAEVLMASTYPLEVVQADRWVQENKNLKGDALKAAPRTSKRARWFLSNATHHLAMIFSALSITARRTAFGKGRLRHVRVEPTKEA